MAPEAHAGLFYIALGLFHKEHDVRLKTVELLERIGEHDAGQHWWRGLGRFEKLAFSRIRREAEASIKGVGHGPGRPGVIGRISDGNGQSVAMPDLDRRIS